MLKNTNISKALENFKDPLLAQNYSELGWAKIVGDILRIRLGYPGTAQQLEAIKDGVQACLEASALSMELEVVCKISRHRTQEGIKPQKGVKNVIAIGSGKGGVGKSTLAANLALALSTLGAKVGLLDADIYGPSQPSIFGLKGKPAVKENKFIPLQAYGLHILSMGLLVEENQAMIWRGPMVSGALLQLFQESHWPDLDYLILDLPPGTGDIQLTMSQKLPIAGSVVVTTPQDLSLLDANKAISMFEKVKIPVLGIIENMSTFVCSNCQHHEPVFGHRGGQKIAEQRNISMLGEIPLDRDISLHTEQGVPTVAKDSESKQAQIFIEVAQKIAANLALRPAEYQLNIQTVEA